MLHIALTCCLVAGALAAPQYNRGTQGYSRNAIQPSALPRPFTVSKSPYQKNGGSSGYGAGGGGYGSSYGSENGDQPANYDFAYEVNAPEYNVQFGHRETRRDMTARGSYSVLLPDGRIQVVEYEADENGYRPTVTYRAGNSNGGYGGNRGGSYGGNGGYGQSGNGGYGGSQGERGSRGYAGKGNGVYGGNRSGGYPPKGSGAGKGSYGQKGNGYLSNNGYGNGLSGGYQG